MKCAYCGAALTGPDEFGAWRAREPVTFAYECDKAPKEPGTLFHTPEEFA